MVDASWRPMQNKKETRRGYDPKINREYDSNSRHELAQAILPRLPSKPKIDSQKYKMS